MEPRFQATHFGFHGSFIHGSTQKLNVENKNFCWVEPWNQGSRLHKKCSMVPGETMEPQICIMSIGWIFFSLLISFLPGRENKYILPWALEPQSASPPGNHKTGSGLAFVVFRYELPPLKFCCCWWYLWIAELSSPCSQTLKSPNPKAQPNPTQLKNKQDVWLKCQAPKNWNGPCMDLE